MKLKDEISLGQGQAPDSLHQAISATEVGFGAQTRKIDGQFVVAPTGNSVNFEIVDASGDYAADASDRRYARYNYKMASTHVEKSFDPKTL